MSTTLTTTSLAASSQALDPCEEFVQHGVYQTDPCRTALVAGTNCFSNPLVTLIMQYLPPVAPTTRKWETEWTGPSLGRDVVWFTLNNACTSLANESGSKLTKAELAINKACGSLAEEQLVTNHTVTGKLQAHNFTLRRDQSCLDIINDYLVKSNMYGAERIEKAYTRNRILQLCPNYNRDYQLPLEIDDLMQTQLTDKFAHPDALDGLPAHVTRYTHLFGLYLKPQGMTARISEKLSLRGSFRKFSYEVAIADDDNTPTKTTEWRWFGEYVLGRNMSWENQLALLPPGLEPPVLSDVFCDFTHFACTDAWILGKKPPSYTNTSKHLTSRVIFGNAGAHGLDVAGSTVNDDEARGIIPCGSS